LKAWDNQISKIVQTNNTFFWQGLIAYFIPPFSIYFLRLERITPKQVANKNPINKKAIPMNKTTCSIDDSLDECSIKVPPNTNENREQSVNKVETNPRFRSVDPTALFSCSEEEKDKFIFASANIFESGSSRLYEEIIFFSIFSFISITC